jgi:uncharacterized protein (DUF2141 family)
MKYLLFILALAQLGMRTPKAAITLTIEVRGFKNMNGTIKLNIQNEEKKEVFQKVEGLKSTTYRLLVTGLDAGKYAVNVFHDKNNNNKLDANWMGIPKEGWGCSNDAKGFMSAPSFKDKLFELKENKTIIINLVHY